AFAFFIAWFAWEASRLTKPILRLPKPDDNCRWLLGAQSFVAIMAILLGLRKELIAPSIWERSATPASVALLAATFLLTARTVSEAFRDTLRTIVIALGVLSLA